jgi:vacuolar protein sorting-associated protein 35
VSQCSEDGGDVNDSVDCILRNFVEMNRLWIRMQSGKSKNREKREAERQDLKVLVGSNFACLSQLDTIDPEYYKTVAIREWRNPSASFPPW